MSHALDESKRMIDRGFRELKAGEDEQNRWISALEAKINTARSHGPGDNFVAAVPDEYRKYIDVAERHGFADPARTVWMGLWWKAIIMGAKAPIQGQNAAPYLMLRDNLEKAAGYDRRAESFRMKDILNEGAGGGGSNVIATPVEAELWRLIRDNTIVRPFATKIIMEGPSMVIPTENANVTAYLVAEGITITDSIASTAFAPQTLVAKKFAGLATVSNELLQDNIIGLQAYLFNSIAEGIGIIEDRGALDGTNFTGVRVATGVNSFTVLSGATTSITGTSFGLVPTYTELVQCVFTALQAASRDTGRFFMQAGVFKNLVGMIDTTGQPVFMFANAAGSFPMFMGGYPVSIVSSLSTSQTTGYTSSSNIYFGPPSRLLYGDISGMSFDIDPYSLLSTVQTRVRVLKRTGILCPVGGYWTFAKGARWV